MVGRNEPCPCGSGKKYKKCCWAKDRAAQAQARAEREAQSEPEIPDITSLLDVTPILDVDRVDDPDLEPEIDPLMERINDFWEVFTDAPYEKKWTLVAKMLANEPELCDGEMVFEITNTLFAPAIEVGEMERFKQLLDQLEETVPDAYTEELQYILEWRISIALMEEDDASVKKYFHQFSPLAGDQLDTYYQIMSALSYHGKLDILHEGMRQARPFIAAGSNLVPWAYGEFTETLGDIEILSLVNQNPDLRSDDPVLQQRLKEYELKSNEVWLANALDYRVGRKKPAWTVADFNFVKGEEEDPAKENLGYLLNAFVHYLYLEEKISFTKAEMVRQELARYLGRRNEGELAAEETAYGRRRKHSRKRKSKRKRPQHPLCPDAQTLDRHLSDLLGFLSSQQYEAFALFELLPAWFRFLIQFDLLDEVTRQTLLQELSYLKGHLIQIAGNNLPDFTVKENMLDWPYEAHDDV